MSMVLWYMELVAVTLIVGAVLSAITFVFSWIAFKIASCFEGDE